MAGGDDSPTAPPRRHRREPLRAAPSPELSAALTPETDLEPDSSAKPGRISRLAGALRQRANAVAAVTMVVAVGAAVVAAAGADDAATDPASEPIVVLESTDDSVRTETSAPRVEGASAAAPQAAAPADPLVPGGDLGALTLTDGVPVTGGYTDLIRSYFGPLTVEAIVIVQCESNFDPLAVGENTNGTRDHGLFQINDVHEKTFEAVTGHSWSDVYDPTLNTAFAKWLHDHAGGWGPWRCNRNLEAFQTDAEPGDEPASDAGV